MKINEQYHNLNLLENVTYEFLGRDGETHEETEPILVEHMMDVYVNERLTMKLVCIPQHLTELVLGRLFTEGIISSAEDVEQIYICEFGKRARVILSKNKSGQSHEENEDYVALTPTCCTGNRVLNDDIKDKIIPEIQESLQKIYDKTCELDVEMIPEESLKKMLKSNEDKLSMLDMTVLYEFVEKGE